MPLRRGPPLTVLLERRTMVHATMLMAAMPMVTALVTPTYFEFSRKLHHKQLEYAT
jgi:hypothetical protein